MSNIEWELTDVGIGKLVLELEDAGKIQLPNWQHTFVGREAAKLQAKMLVGEVAQWGMTHTLKLASGVEDEVFLIPMKKWRELCHQVGI